MIKSNKMMIALCVAPIVTLATIAGIVSICHIANDFYFSQRLAYWNRNVRSNIRIGMSRPQAYAWTRQMLNLAPEPRLRPGIVRWDATGREFSSGSFFIAEADWIPDPLVFLGDDRTIDIFVGFDTQSRVQRREVRVEHRGIGSL